MKNVLFAKYNRTRKKEYQISTCVYEENDVIKVSKKALCSEAVSHIESLKDKSKKLEAVLKSVKVLQPEIDNGIATYQYIDGETVEERLNANLLDIDLLISEINRYNSILFDFNEEFVNEDKVSIGNVDCLYDNFIEKDGEIYCLDCEWVFEYSIPIDFLKYRSLYYFYKKYEEYLIKNITLDNFLMKFGITKEMSEEFFKTEDEYQHYVHGPNSECVYTDNYKKPVMEMSELVDEGDSFSIASLKDLQKKDRDIANLNELCHIKDNTISDKDKYISDLENIIQNIQADPVYKIGRAPRKVVKKVLGLFQKKKVEYDVLDFKKCDNPTVSIIIPVYNQFDYTYNCLKSIKENTQNISYEVIIGDDVSKDKTKKIAKYANNITVVRHKENLGFLRNCNECAKIAKGKYVVFLNNDTTVTEGWLDTLVELMENDESIGLTGSKLIYPNGILQEVGGIVWKNADAWNYGRNDVPEKAEYNYARETDYISGAAIMIRKNIWEKIGGFDERYVPAYYEDTDLAFEVRKLGYRVVVQPKSVVVHYEGISNGTNVENGIKKYQIENKEKFRLKWQNELENHFENPNGVFLGRDRSQNKKIALFIDRYIPQYDKDAGSKSTLSYIRAFIKMGYNVKFLPEDFERNEKYASYLENMGVEVLCGSWYLLNIDKWIKDYGEYIDVVFSNRPFTTNKFIDILRENVKGKILYYGHDLHYNRELREYAISGDKQTLKHANQMKKLEYSIMEQADVVYYPSYLEIDVIKKELPNINAKAIPVYVYEEPNERKMISAKDRKDILFVGGFAHAPNVDAVEWFMDEIFDKILEANPDIKFNIVGSNPPENITKLSNNNVIVKGFVSEEELEELYTNVRLVVVPLRFGAGMKGKVIEALYNNIPVITTSIGAEGLVEYEDVLIVEDEAEKFAGKVVELYKDTDKIDKMSAKMPKYIEDYFSLNAAAKIIGGDL